MKGEPIPESVVKNYLEDISRGLYFLHSNDIIHRSLCPEHILIDSNDKPKITLFGLTRFIKQCTSHPDKEKLSPVYNSPETFSELGYRKAADVWALGCTIYELCTFKVKFKHIIESL